MASYWDRENFARLQKLKFDVGTPVVLAFTELKLRSPLVRVLKRSHVQQTLVELYSRKILNREQWDKLYPPGGSDAQPRQFDLTLLFVLVSQLIPNLTPEESADLKQLEILRNDSASAQVPDQVFHREWGEVEAAILRLEPLDKPQRQRDIRLLLQNPEDPQTQYLDAMFRDVEDNFRGTFRAGLQLTEPKLEGKIDDGSTTFNSQFDDAPRRKLDTGTDAVKKQVDVSRSEVGERGISATGDVSDQLDDATDRTMAAAQDNISDDGMEDFYNLPGDDMVMLEPGLRAPQPPQLPQPLQQDVDLQQLTTGRPEDKVFRVIHNCGLFDGARGSCIWLHLQVAGTQLTIVAWADHTEAYALSHHQLKSGNVFTGLSGRISNYSDSPPGISPYSMKVSSSSGLTKIDDDDSPDEFWSHEIPDEYTNLVDTRNLPNLSWFNIRGGTIATDVWQPTGNTEYSYRSVLKDDSFPNGIPIELLSPQAEALETLMAGKTNFEVTLHYAQWMVGNRNEGPFVRVGKDTYVFFRR